MAPRATSDIARRPEREAHRRTRCWEPTATVRPDDSGLWPPIQAGRPPAVSAAVRIRTAVAAALARCTTRDTEGADRLPGPYREGRGRPGSLPRADCRADDRDRRRQSSARRQDEVDGASEQGDRSLCAPDSVGRSDVLRKSRGDRVRSHTLDRAPAVLSPRDSVISEHLRTGSNYPSAACALYQNRSRSRIRSLQNIGLPNQTGALSPMACAVR